MADPNVNTDLTGQTQAGGNGSLSSQLSALSGLSSGTTSKTNPTFIIGWDGSQETDGHEGFLRSPLKTTASAYWTTISQDPTQLSNMVDALTAGGFITSKNPSMSTLQSDYLHAMQSLSAAQAKDPSLTIGSFFVNAARARAALGYAQPGAGGTSGDGTVTSIYEMSPDEARYKLTNAMQQWLGRDPSQGEIQDFTGIVNQDARSNPSTTTTSGTTGNKLKQTQKGFSPLYGADDQAMLYAKHQPDYAAYQAATTYWNALQQSLNASVQGVGVV